MANYRDDRDALRDKADVLEGELAGTKAELEAKEAELGRKDAELAELRKIARIQRPGSDRTRAVVVATLTIGGIVAGGVFAFITVRAGPPMPPPPPAERVAAVTAPAPPPARDPAIPGPLHRAHFLARVVKVVGRTDVTIDQLCNVRASAHGLGVEQTWQELEVECGGVELYRRSNTAGKIMSFTGGRLARIPGDDGGTKGYSLHYEETGTRTGDAPHIALDSELEHGRIYTDGAVRTEVSFKLDKVGTSP